MPRRDDIHSILIIGSGPIIIGQASEFDYSGTQALKALKEEHYKIILVNSNPATIMTDPEFADRTYLEPLTVEYLEKIIHKENENHYERNLRVYPNNLFVTRPSEKHEAKAAGQKGSEA